MAEQAGQLVGELLDLPAERAPGQQGVQDVDVAAGPCGATGAGHLVEALLGLSPRFRAPRGTIVHAADPGDLAAQIRQVQAAATGQGR